MPEGHSEYQVKYCGLGGEETKGGGANDTANSGLAPCTKNYDIQPVGGRVQNMFQKHTQERLHAMHQAAGTGQGSANTTQYEDTFSVEGYTKTPTKAVQASMLHAQWMDRRWLPPGWEPNPRSTAAEPVAMRYSRYMYMMPAGNQC